MLGKTLSDPQGVEDGGSMRGIGLLDTETVFLPQKRRTRMNGTICSQSGVFEQLSGLSVSGYEIHMGETKGFDGAVPFTVLESGEIDGYCNADGTVFGSYLHGIFDNSEMAQGMVQVLLKRKGVSFDEMKPFDLEAYKQQQYDKLADILRENLDMDKIYDILNRREVKA